jgi:C1A family cysteine protease
VVHGWNDKIAGGSWICRNSWGLAWGDRGDFYMPYAMWSVALPEAWKALDIIGDR